MRSGKICLLPDPTVVCFCLRGSYSYCRIEEMAAESGQAIDAFQETDKQQFGGIKCE